MSETVQKELEEIKNAAGRYNERREKLTLTAEDIAKAIDEAAAKDKAQA